MKVKVLKSGKWATKPPENDHILLAKGQERTDIPEEHLKTMVTYGWAEVIDEDPTTPPPEEAPEVIPTPETAPPDEEYSVEADINDIVALAKDDKEAKDLLKIWGQERGIKVNKVFGVAKIVAQLIKEYHAE